MDWQHYNNITFKTVWTPKGNVWEFYRRDPFGFITFLTARQLKGLGRARAFAKKLYQKEQL